jgi:hypothetical protein
MRLSEFHEPVALIDDAKVSGVPPPDGSMVFSCPCATKAIMLESGDQNGDPAPSVPGKAIALRESSGRTHNRTFPSGSDAANARRRPLGDTAKRPTPPSCPAPGNKMPSGKSMDVR